MTQTKQKIKLSKITYCSHLFFGEKQMKLFGRDQCRLCREWIHKEVEIAEKESQNIY